MKFYLEKFEVLNSELPDFQKVSYHSYTNWLKKPVTPAQMEKQR